MNDKDELDRSDHAELAVVRITEFGARDEISEDLAPSEEPVTLLESTTQEMRRWVVGGVGMLMALAMILSFAIVLFRPALVDFAGQFLQLVVGGLIGLAGSIIGFLIGRDKL